MNSDNFISSDGYMNLGVSSKFVKTQSKLIKDMLTSMIDYELAETLGYSYEGIEITIENLGVSRNMTNRFHVTLYVYDSEIKFVDEVSIHIKSACDIYEKSNRLVADFMSQVAKIKIKEGK